MEEEEAAVRESATSQESDQDRVAAKTRQLAWQMVMSTGEAAPQNTFLSPLSIVIALGMLAGGADTTRRKELASMLGIEDPTTLKTTFASQLAELSSYSEQGIFHLANAVFSDATFRINRTYMQYLESFQAEAFEYETLSRAADSMNNWISKHTMGMIPRMVSARTLENIHISLINAVAFKGVWKRPFMADLTTEKFPFHISASETCPVSMMRREKKQALIADESTYKAVRLAYDTAPESAPMSFVAYLPTEDTSLQELMQHLSEHSTPQFKLKTVDLLAIPKFRIQNTLQIHPILCKLGYPINGLNPAMGDGPSQVESIIHSAVINMDEKGTMAAAATIINYRKKRIYSPRIVFDRPFAFSILAGSNDMIVFNGVFAGR